MNATSNASEAPSYSARQLWHRTPKAWVGAAVVAAFGWLFTLGGSTTTTINGVTHCEALDLGPFITAGIVLLAVLAGANQQRTEHAGRRLPPTHAWVIGGVLTAAAAAYLIVGLLNPAGSFC